MTGWVIRASSLRVGLSMAVGLATDDPFGTLRGGWRISLFPSGKGVAVRYDTTKDPPLSEEFTRMVDP